MVCPCQDSSTYPKILYAKFPAAVSPFHIVRTERWALASLCLHLRGAGNGSFSPCPLKSWGWGVLPTRRGNTRQVGCWQLLVAVSPQGMRLFRVCWNESVQWIRSTVTAPRQTNLSLPFRGNFMQVTVWFHQISQHELFPDHIRDDFWFWWRIFISQFMCTDCLAKPS